MATKPLRTGFRRHRTVRESPRAKIRTVVKRILRRYGYALYNHEQATPTVLEQAELLCTGIAA